MGRARMLCGCPGMMLGSTGSSWSCFSLPSWALWALEACERSNKGDLWGWQSKTLCLAVCSWSLPPAMVRSVWLRPVL